MLRTALSVAGLGALTLLSVAGCTSAGGDTPSSSGPVPSSSTPTGGPSTPATGPSIPATGAGTDVPSATNAPSTPAPSGAVTGPTPPDVPTVPEGSAGAYTLVVSGGGSVTTPVPTVTCQQDGSLQAGGLALAAGGTNLRFTDVAPVGTLDIPGSADVSAAGGTFRGSSGTTAVTFTWTC